MIQGFASRRSDICMQRKEQTEDFLRKSLDGSYAFTIREIPPQGW